MTDIASKPGGPTGEISAPTPSLGVRPGTWEGVLQKYEERLNAAGFPAEDVPDPQESEFPSFLAELHAANPVLASDLSRSLRRLKDYGSLPSGRSSRRRDRNRRIKQSALMREENGVFVFDKKKAPVYGLLTLGLILGPLMYFLSKPELGNTSIKMGGGEEKKASAKVEIKKPSEASPEPSVQEASSKPKAKKAADS